MVASDFLLPQEQMFISKIWEEFSKEGLAPQKLLEIMVKQLFSMMLNPEFSSMFLSLQVRKKARESLTSIIDAATLCGNQSLQSLQEDISAKRYDTPELLQIGRTLTQTAKFLQDIVETADADSNSLGMMHKAALTGLSEEFRALPERGQSWVYFGLGIVISIAKELNIIEQQKEKIKELKDSEQTAKKVWDLE